jgi:EpsI family protein
MVEMWHPVWGNLGETRRVEQVGESTLPLRQTRLRSAGQKLVIWDWYVISGTDIANPYVAKLMQARDLILGRGDDGVVIMVAAPYDEATAGAEQVLRDFIVSMRGSIDASVAAALGQ